MPAFRRQAKKEPAISIRMYVADRGRHTLDDPINDSRTRDGDFVPAALRAGSSDSALEFAWWHGDVAVVPMHMCTIQTMLRRYQGSFGRKMRTCAPRHDKCIERLQVRRQNAREWKRQVKLNLNG